MTPLIQFPARGLKVVRPSAAIAQSKAVHLTYPAELFFGIADHQLADRPIGTRNAYAVFALCYACMQYRAAKLSEPPVWIFEEQDGEDVPIEGEHELSELLEQPNPDMGMAEFMEQVSLYLDATGAVLLVKNSDRAGITRSMYPYAKDEFAVEPADGRLYGRFKVQTLTGYRTLGPDEVIYLKRPATDHIMNATAAMDAALSHINIGHAMRTAIQAAMRHTVRPGTIFRAPANLGDDQFNRLKSEIAESYAGLWNMGKSMLVEGGIEADVQKATLSDLALGPINEDVEVAVCQAFQVHPLLVGSKIGMGSNSGFADSIEPAQNLFYDVSAFPLWTRIEKALTAGLLRPVDANPLRFIRFDKSKVRALQPDLTEKIEQASKAVFWTEAEKRQWTGKEDGSDELPSDKAERQAEEQLAMADAAPEQNGNGNGRPVPAGKHRLIDLVKTETGYTAQVRNGKH